jgi:hypothetical protein
MNRPFDKPTEAGQRVRARKLTREGKVDWIKDNWVGMKWDDGYGPEVCHVNELQKIEK